LGSAVTTFPHSGRFAVASPTLLLFEAIVGYSLAEAVFQFSRERITFETN